MTPTLVYGSELVNETRDISRIQSIEMRCLRKVKGCTKLHIKN
jgi:hypothetical protein